MGTNRMKYLCSLHFISIANFWQFYSIFFFSFVHSFLFCLIIFYVQQFIQFVVRDKRPVYNNKKYKFFCKFYAIVVVVASQFGLVGVKRAQFDWIYQLKWNEWTILRVHSIYFYFGFCFYFSLSLETAHFCRQLFSFSAVFYFYFLYLFLKLFFFFSLSIRHNIFCRPREKKKKRNHIEQIQFWIQMC